MGLSPDLISEFVKVTNDTKKSNTSNSMFGTVCEYDGSYYVKFDGSDLLTPISTTTDIHDGERVMVTIKNHTAIITGNMSSPSVNLETTIDNGEEGTVKLSELGISIHDGVVKINELEAKALTAESAVIKELKANDVTITGKLDVNESDISKLKTDKLDASTADIKYATIENLKATNANIENLDADVADINTLIFGSATGDVIHTSFANAVIAQLGVAQIKSAMIDSVSADKITAGNIVTNNVQVMSEDGKLLISDETIQISDGTRVRVQIGKDASGDYSINIWDVDGNLMFSEGGITDKAIKDAIIRNDMVSETANISASKLNVDSLFTEINNSSKTIKSSKIYLNDEEQTLDVAFTSMTTDVDGVKKDVKSQGTQLSIVQGKIDSKVWQQDIDTAKGEMNTKYSSLEQNLDGFKTTVSDTYTTKDDLDDLQIGGRNLAMHTSSEWIQTQVHQWSGGLGYHINGSDRTGKLVSFEEIGLNIGDDFTISIYLNAINKPINLRVDLYRGSTLGEDYNNYSTATVEIGTTKRVVYTNTVTEEFPYFAIYIGSGDITDATVTIEQYKCLKIEKGNKATDWTPAPEDMSTVDDTKNLQTNLEERITKAESVINQLSNAISMLVRDSAGQSQMTQTSTETEFAFFSTEEIDKAIEDASTSIGNLTEEYGGTKEAVEALQQQLADFGERVKISTYEDEPCIILYESDTGYKQIITNTRHIFLQTIDGVDEVKSITDYSISKTDKVIARKEMQVGGYVMRQLTGGGVIFTWEGVTE